jgi:hypothetical protein
MAPSRCTKCRRRGRWVGGRLVRLLDPVFVLEPLGQFSCNSCFDLPCIHSSCTADFNLHICCRCLFSASSTRICHLMCSTCSTYKWKSRSRGCKESRSRVLSWSAQICSLIYSSTNSRYVYRDCFQFPSCARVCGCVFTFVWLFFDHLCTPPAIR